MKIHLKRWMKGAFVVSLLLGASAAQATITAFEEQVLDETGFTGNNKNAGGYSVAIDGEWAFVGDDSKCQVVVYKFNALENRWGNGEEGAAWEIGHGYVELNPTPASCNADGVEGFGSVVSVHKGFVAVGAPRADTVTQNNAGKVMLYKYDDSQKTCDTDTCRKGWVRIATADGAVDRRNGVIETDVQLNAEYGSSVSIRQNKNDPSKAMLVIGARYYDETHNGIKPESGKVYFWEWDGTQFNFMAAAAGENAYDEVGTAVTSNGQEMLASAPYFDTSPFTDSGAVYMFEYNAGTQTLDLEHRFESGDTYNGHNVTPPLESDFHLGMTLSYVDTVIALGGIDTNGFDHIHGVSLTHRGTVENTYEGDVSQSGSAIVVAQRGTPDGVVNIFADKYNTDPNNPTYQITKTEDDWGRDVSVSIPNIMVNGNNGGKKGVAYAYFAGCGFGGNLLAGEWKMIGPQCEVYSDAGLTVDATIAEVYADLGTYGTNWIMWRQDGADYSGRSAAYVVMQANESMVVGVGYWIISFTDATYQVSESLYARYIVKGLPPVLDAPDDSYDRSNIRAVTDLNLRAMMGSITNGRDGDEDVRTMLSNPLIAPTVWADAYMHTGQDDYLVGGTAIDLFEGTLPNAYLWHNGIDDTGTGVGTVGAGFIPVTGTPGMTHQMVGGEGFTVKFSALFTSILKNTTDIPSLHLAEQY